MSIAAALTRDGTGNPRWLLLGSLALNLFFVGIAVAMLVRQPPPVDRTVSARIERLAAALPAPDAEILRRTYQTNRGAVDGARAAYDNSRNAIREALRHEPFDPAVMRNAMTQNRSARQNFDQTLQGVIVAAATEMSPAGRTRLAAYPPGSQSANAK